jgi:hypothetical protein
MEVFHVPNYVMKLNALVLLVLWIVWSLNGMAGVNVILLVVLVTDNAHAISLLHLVMVVLAVPTSLRPLIVV